MEIFLWIMFLLSLWAMAANFLSITRAGDFVAGMMGLALFGFGLIVYYLSRG